ncbi:hypothetical protein AB1Y20_010140 [Prymnesium parvum]|uniref:Phospholipid/glycerol acyltransferase domain-containing protein n=1 Tax=Prymnesium parvum TaxID=97485 RepID=A0AB34K5Z3_PRYPA
MRALCGWILVVVHMLFLGTIGPLFACAAWLPLLLVAKVCPPSDTFYLKVRTPWDVFVHAYVVLHGIRVFDADGGHGVFVPDVANFKGAFMMNHRSWGDFAIDPAQSDASVVARTAAVAVGLLAGLMGLLSKKVIMINRGTTSRLELMAMCAKHQRYLIYPEGTRRAHLPDADKPCALRVGGLKNVYESGHKAFIVITVGKEEIVNERRGTIHCGTKLYRARHPPLDPANYSKFEDFLSAFERAWQQTWLRAYQYRAEVEAANSGASETGISMGMV